MRNPAPEGQQVLMHPHRHLLRRSAALPAHRHALRLLHRRFQGPADILLPVLRQPQYHVPPRSRPARALHRFLLRRDLPLRLGLLPVRVPTSLATTADLRVLSPPSLPRRPSRLLRRGLQADSPGLRLRQDRRPVSLALKRGRPLRTDLQRSEGLPTMARTVLRPGLILAARTAFPVHPVPVSLPLKTESITAPVPLPGRHIVPAREALATLRTTSGSSPRTASLLVSVLL